MQRNAYTVCAYLLVMVVIAVVRTGGTGAAVQVLLLAFGQILLVQLGLESADGFAPFAIPRVLREFAVLSEQFLFEGTLRLYLAQATFGFVLVVTEFAQQFVLET